VHLDADSVLFGEIAFAPLERVLIGGADLGPRAAWLGGVLIVAQLAYLRVFGYEMGAMTFDPQGSRAAGARKGLVQGTAMVLLSVTAAAAFSAAGAVMATALLVMPTVAAGLWTRRFWPLVWAGCAAAGVSTLGGAWAATAWDLSVSGWIVALLFFIVLFSALAAPGRGLVSGALSRARQKRRFAGEMLVVHLASHEGTEGEALESTFDHLVEELGWDGDQAALAVAEAVRRGAVVNERGALRLTDEGRRWAARLDIRQN
jgi:manganese/zinc/iron transport system permease protein